MDTTFQEQMIRFIRLFGLHHPEQTPCGKAVTTTEAHALMELQKSQTLTQKQLVEQLNLAKSTVSRLVGKLVKRGWISKQPHPEDGRVLELTLTESGQNIAQELAIARNQKFHVILTHVPQEQQSQLIQAFSILNTAIQEANDEN